MTTPQPGQLAPRKPVRLWPGVVMAVLLLLVRFGLPVVLAESAMLGMIAWIVGACWCSRKKRSWRWSARRRISSKRSRECRRSTARHGIIQPWLTIGCSFAMAKRWPRFASLQSKGAQFPLDAQACRCGRRPLHAGNRESALPLEVGATHQLPRDVHVYSCQISAGAFFKPIGVLIGRGVTVAVWQRLVYCRDSARSYLQNMHRASRGVSLAHDSPGVPGCLEHTLATWRSQL